MRSPSGIGRALCMAALSAVVLGCLTLSVEAASTTILDFEDLSSASEDLIISYRTFTFANAVVAETTTKYAMNVDENSPMTLTRESQPFSPVRVSIARAPFVTSLNRVRVEGVKNGATVATVDITPLASGSAFLQFAFPTSFQVGITSLRFSGFTSEVSGVGGFYGIDNFEYANGALVSNDPHVRTFDGQYMTAYEEGDFVLAASATTGLAVHGRFCKNSRGSWAPWTCAVALRCSADESAVEVFAHVPALPSAKGTSMIITQHPNGVATMSCPGHVTLAFDRQRFHRMSYLNLLVTPTPTSGAESDLAGLLGTPNGQSHDDLTHREGTISGAVEAREHHIGSDDLQLAAIRESWRVREDEQLFKTSFAPPVAQQARRRSVISQSAAEKICVDGGVVDKYQLAMCAHDVSMTGSAALVPNFLSGVAAQ